MGLLGRLLSRTLGTGRPSTSDPDGRTSQRGAAARDGAERQFADIYAQMDSGRYDEALAACLVVPLLTNTAPWIPLAEGLLQSGHAALARQLLAHLDVMYPGDPAIQERIALVALAQADFAAARTAATRAAALDPARPWPGAVLAECLLQEKRYDEAEAAYQALSAAGSEWLMCRTVYFSRALFDGLSGVNEDLPPPLTVLAPTAEDFDFVALVSCDRTYFAEYGGSFVNAYARNGGTRGLLHLHVVDPPADFAAVVTRLVAKTGIAKFAVTSEMTPFPELPAPKRRVFYTCARFLHFGAWLETYRKPIVCFDVDAIIERPLTPLLEACAHADLGLVLRPARRAIWLDVVAYAVLARPTPAAIAYFRLLRRFLLQFARQRLLYWQIDQIALSCVLIMLRRFGSAPAVHDIYDAIDDVAWLLARRRSGGKSGDPVYLGYRIEI